MSAETLEAIIDGRLSRAIHEWMDLQARKIHPEGKFRRNGAFFLRDKFDCCLTIRKPSKRFPHLEMKHGRSMLHIARKYNINLSVFRRIALAKKRGKTDEEISAIINDILANGAEG